MTAPMWPPNPPDPPPHDSAVEYLRERLAQIGSPVTPPELLHLAALLELRIGMRMLGMLTGAQARRVQQGHDPVETNLGEDIVVQITRSEAADLAVEVLTDGPRAVLRRPLEIARPLDG